MQIDEYQQLSRQYAIYPGRGLGLDYCVIGLAGEVGELCNIIKKKMKSKDSDYLAKHQLRLMFELGDILWYLTQIASELGLTMQQISWANLTKLGKRFEQGTIEGDGDER